MVDETNETQADGTQPGEPQLADMGAVMELVRHLGQIMSNTSLYGTQHKVTQQAINKGQLWDGMPLPPPCAPVAEQEPTPPEDSKPPETAPPMPRRVGRRIIFED